MFFPSYYTESTVLLRSTNSRAGGRESWAAAAAASAAAAAAAATAAAAPNAAAAPSVKRGLGTDTKVEMAERERICLDLTRLD